MARSADFDLAAELARPGFTPARGDVAALVELVIGGNERAMAPLAGLGAVARGAIVEKLPSSDEGAAARLVQALGLVARAGDLDAREQLIALVGDARVRVRRAAIVALGKLASQVELELRSGGGRRRSDRRTADAPVVVELRDGDTRRIAQRRDEGGDQVQVGVEDHVHDQEQLEAVRRVLVARWDAADVSPDERRALAEALGKVGGDEALARLRGLDAGGDKELLRLRDRAVLMADRSAKREAVSTIAIDVAPPRPLRVRLGCRPQIGELLRDELAGLGITPRDVRADGVEVELAGPWSTLHRARLWATAGIVVPLVAADDLATSIVRTVTSDGVLALLRAWTHGPIRWRLDIAQRAVIWSVAKAVAAKVPELINDPSATTWEFQIDPGTHTLLLVPRRIEDPRFAYRIAEVPAASHGSVAAAIVWLGAPRANDRVWDPFCGSGVELVECARRGARSLRGTDLDPKALDAARANLAAAEVTAELAVADAMTHAPGMIDLIVTNPPLGSRVHVDAAALLVQALPGFARTLVAGGRLVWITPSAKKTGPAAERAGLVLDRSLAVDLGGVRGRLERWIKR